MKPINIQTVAAEIERLERATDLSLREEYHLQCLKRLWEYMVKVPLQYAVYHIAPDGKRTHVGYADGRPEFVDPSEGIEYVALIERP